MSSEKTERPTPQRLRKAREEGNVAKSKDFTQTLLLAALFGYTLAAGPGIFREMAQMIRLPAGLWSMPPPAAIALALESLVRAGIVVLLPYLLIVVVVGVAAEVMQSGFLFSLQALMPKGDKLDPVNNFKQMFGGKAWVEFFKSCLKVAILTVVVYMVIRDALGPLVKIPLAGLGTAGLVLAEMMHTLIVYTFVIFAALAIADFLYQRYSYTKGLMMSMEEIKQEHKQAEGDPHMKGHRKELARDIVLGDDVEKTHDASVVVTNPTHVAVAIRFVEGETPLPIVLCKGEGEAAEAIRRIAAGDGIPVMQNIPLARALLAKADVGRYVPGELLEPVAAILVAIKRLAQEKEMEEGIHD